MAKNVPPVRFSHLRAYGRSPMHGRHARTTDRGDQTYAMERGTAVHALLFGNKKVVGYPGAQRRGKEYEAFAASNPETEILTLSEYDKARRMADAVRANELAREVLTGTPEQTLLFRWMGVDCRATPDIRGQKHITELKTSQNVDPDRFVWHALRMHYHAQMKFQQYAAGESITCYLVAVESVEPYPVTVFELTPRALEAGEKLLTLWMERLKICEAANTYPAYSSMIVPLDVPDDEPLEFGEDDGD